MFPLSSTLIGQNISGYRIEKLLGRGGTGMVFLGVRFDNPSDRVAIKILAPAWSITDDEMESLRRRFLREFDTYQRLRHAHIVPIRGFGQTITDDDLTLSYMILPYLEGGTLTEVMAKGLMPLPTIAAYLRDLADAVDYAHSKAVVHRDIKPANVLLNNEQRIFLTDFGIAQLFDQQQRTLTASGQVIGTPEYMSPEQASGKEISPQTDQYSLGVMAFEMAAGRVPFTGPTIIDYLKQHSMTPPPSAKELRPDLPDPAAAALANPLAEAKRSTGFFANAFASAAAAGSGRSGRSSFAEGGGVMLCCLR
jgi:eukaryotic-like serine/threonine-protein kinase